MSMDSIYLVKFFHKTLRKIISAVDVPKEGGVIIITAIIACLEAAWSIRVQRPLVIQPVRGNFGRKRRLYSDNLMIPKSQA